MFFVSFPFTTPTCILFPEIPFSFFEKIFFADKKYPKKQIIHLCSCFRIFIVPKIFTKHRFHSDDFSESTFLISGDLFLRNNLIKGLETIFKENFTRPGFRWSLNFYSWSVLRQSRRCSMKSTKMLGTGTHRLSRLAIFFNFLMRKGNFTQITRFLAKNNFWNCFLLLH